MNHRELLAFSERTLNEPMSISEQDIAQAQTQVAQEIARTKTLWGGLVWALKTTPLGCILFIVLLAQFPNASDFLWEGSIAVFIAGFLIAMRSFFRTRALETIDLGLALVEESSTKLDAAAVQLVQTQLHANNKPLRKMHVAWLQGQQKDVCIAAA